MLTPSQKIFIDALLGPQGHITQTIRSFSGCSQSIRLLYFKRAVYHQGEEFLNFIDKLFIPNLENTAFQNLLDFVNLLKLLNDLCFNNLIDYHEQQSRPALLCYLGNESINPDEIQQTIQTMVRQRCTEILTNFPVSMLLEIQLRKILEKDIQPNMEWRAYSNLPGSQRPLLDPRPRGEINLHLSLTSRDVANSVEEFELYANDSQLDLGIRMQLLKNFEHFRALMQASIHIKDLMALSTHERAFLLTNAPSVVLFLTSMNLYPKLFMKLPFEKKEFFLNAFEGISSLIYQISTRQSPFKEELSFNLNATYHYCYIQKIPLEAQLILPFPIRQLLYLHYEKIYRLTSQLNIAIDKIFTLTFEPLDAILANFGSLIKLLNHHTINFEKLCQQNVELIKEILNYCDAYIQLTEQKYFNLDELLICEPLIRKLLLNHCEQAVYLVSSDSATASELLDLPAAHLYEALSNPYDQADLELIIPSSYNNCVIL